VVSVKFGDSDSLYLVEHRCLKSDHAAAKHLTASLDKFKVPEKEKGEILAFVTTLKNDIVEK
jgi:hypothetical protein